MSASASRKGTKPDPVAVIGAGVIGLSIAFELAVRRGARVTVYDVRPPGRGASWAAAGMLAPAFEAAGAPGVHARLFELCLKSAQLWPAFAAEIEAHAGAPVGLGREASLAVALDAAEGARLAGLAATLKASGTPFDTLSPDELHRREPALAPDVRAGLELPTDIRVHNRALVSALLAVLRAHPKVRMVDGPAPLTSWGSGVRLEGHAAIVAAAGWETPVIKVLERSEPYSLLNWDPVLDDIDCHGGQMLSVAAIPAAPKRVVRAGEIYLVPRGDAVVIGATVEPGRVLDAAEDAAIETLRREGVRVCPGLAGAPVLERWAGVRPGTPDKAPFIGETAAPGLFVAAGHYRNGILLAPVTAEITADLVLGNAPGKLAAAFAPVRPQTATA